MPSCLFDAKPLSERKDTDSYLTSLEIRVVVMGLDQQVSGWTLTHKRNTDVLREVEGLKTLINKYMATM